MAGVIQPVNFSYMKCDVPKLKGDNYKVWKERILLHLGWMDIDYAIRKDEHPKIIETSTPDQAIDDQFVTSDKALASTLIMQFSSIKLTKIKGVHDHLMCMRDIAAQLKVLEVKMLETFLVQYILCTLPQQYGPFKIFYNTHKDKWSIDELMNMCVQEEGRLAMEDGEKVNLIVLGKENDQAK
ncbi:hypothetical protein FEM48_Zijuj11G0073300 [Ziziphus jujuba var. spinosa]|uniref:DUF4219 domain-containing protein n=1 Tax=Ziziphus jujuba var. spinosa TaxID=714518 RepID=A0A978UHL3_ZIZJJ|nr:hypothetical protein FEM48_Zijuj11G0073300 [Ziziphus jujuba var. spinosa]